MSALPLTIPSIEWMRKGSCRTTSIDFFSDNPLEIEHAKAVCADCPVRIECLLYAKSNHEEVGVWGGTTPAERGIISFTGCLRCGGRNSVPVDTTHERCLQCGDVWYVPA
jgi:hypothetical protein